MDHGIALFAAGVAAASMVWLIVMLREARERITKLEAANKSHLPFHTASEIENATAALLLLESQKNFDLEYIENALSHLRQAREDRRGKKADLEA